MPVTKTAKRALRSSKTKEAVNKSIINKLEIAIRQAKSKKSTKAVQFAISQADRAAKKNIIHRNKADHLKSQLSRLSPKPKKTASKTKK